MPNSNGDGRPLVITDEILNKLREAFLMGSTDAEACIYADISTASLYNYQQVNLEYKKQKEHWKQNPILKARTTVYKSLDKDETAKWYLERKKRDEFGKPEDNPTVTNNLIVMGNDQLAKYLYGFVSKLSVSGDTQKSGTDAVGGESGTLLAGK